MGKYLEYKESNCKNCYKCIRCCPVKAISFSCDKARILEDECILCGNCYVVCPQHANSIRDDLATAMKLMRGKSEVYASIAPSITAAFPEAGMESIKDALVELGFVMAEETAIGATIVKKRYEDIMREGTQRVIISTCCHSVNTLVQKYYPNAVQYLAKVVSPMHAHALKIKNEHPKSKVIFIGPCISKKAEADEYPGAVDCVLTFEELSHWLKERRITLKKGCSHPSGRTRLFPTTGGILDSLDKEAFEDRAFLAVDGIGNCIKALEDITHGDLHNCFIEMSACAGSCIGGPAMRSGTAFPVRSGMIIRNSAGRKDFEVDMPKWEAITRQMNFIPVTKLKPGGKEIEDVLRRMGKTLPEHELNCGSCGYESCREKAAAVLLGKAEITMCLPYLMERAQSFSDSLFHNTPNGVIVLNGKMQIQQINSSACHMLNIKDEKTILGRGVVCILDPVPFMQVLDGGGNIYEQPLFLAEYQRHVKLTILHDTNYGGIMTAILRDVTDSHAVRASKEEMSRNAIDIADRVIEKQMRTVQEIASLLGETTAETKVALERLKGSLSE